MLSHRHLFIPGAEPSHSQLLLLHGSAGTQPATELWRFVIIN